jgi:uncharacterized protein YkwD
MGMPVKTLLGRKTAAIACTALIVFGLSACSLPDTSSTPPSDPFTNGLYNAMNYDRVAAGLPPLTWSPKLANNAGSWAWQMMHANSLYHQNLSALIYSPDYANYRTLGENIIVGPGSMSSNSIEGAWRNSPPHWANISSRAFNVVGIGYVRGPDGRIWAVQEFGGL